MMADDLAIVVAGHGSRDPAGRAEFEALVGLMANQASGISHAYLEFATPTVEDALRSAVQSGARRVVLLPALLLAAAHAKNDMPGELALLKQEAPATAFFYAGVAELHPLLLRLCQRRMVEAEAAAGHTAARGDTLLVVVGRGTSDPDANAEVYKLARMLEEGMGYGGAYVCYSGTAQPLVMDGLLRAARLGFKRLLVFPLFLFDGVLVKRIYAAADALAARQPELEVLKADYLRPCAELA
ncbi:MAG: sirohydrochlorin chelatase, partial [Methylococcaceae bacterium]